MSKYITIDCGTTNTRIFLIDSDKVVARLDMHIGASKCAEDKYTFKKILRQEIASLILKSDHSEKDYNAIIASGMITSELGLCHIEHLNAPLGLRELHDGLVCRDVGISAIPCYFIPGIKITNGDLEHTDFMRGEETELMGLINGADEEMLYILPGSHSKHILTKGSAITDFRTFLTGEMIGAIANSTILRDAVDLNLSGVDENFLLLGYDTARKLGIGQALFKTRILKNVFSATRHQCYNFFMGVILESEISALEKSEIKNITIGGKGSLRDPMKLLFDRRTDISVRTPPEEDIENCTALGAVKIFEYSRQ